MSSPAFPLTAPGALLPLDAPLPQPRRYTLLDAAQIVPPPDDRWMAGAWINGYPAGPTETVDPCATGTLVRRTEVGTLASGITARMTGSASAMTSCGVR